jgi:hypothetical protein
MAGFRIEGNVSGNVAEVDTNSKLKVNLPVALADTGYAAMASIVHDGSTGQVTPVIRNAEVSFNKRLRVGLDNLWFADRFSYAAQWSAVWSSVLTTMTVTHVPAGFIALNGGASTASGAVANYLTYQMFPCYNGAGLSFECIAKWTQTPQTNNVLELGMFQATTTTAPTDGVLFRLTSAGVLNGVINFNGSETLVDLGTLPSVNEQHNFTIKVETDATYYYIDEVLRGTINTPVSSTGPTINMYQPVHFRNYNSAITGAAQQLQIGEVRVFLRDISDDRGFSTTMCGMGGGGYQGHAGATQGSTALYTNSLATGAGAAATNTTAALGSGLGGQFALLPTLTAGTDGIISSFQVPAATALIPGEALYITGLWIDSKVLLALTGGPCYFAMSLGVGNTAVSLATAEGAATKASRRIPLGYQSFVVNAALGTKSDEGRIFVPFASPVVANPGEFVQVIAKNLGTVTSAGVVLFQIGFDSHYE